MKFDKKYILKNIGMTKDHYLGGPADIMKQICIFYSRSEKEDHVTMKDWYKYLGDLWIGYLDLLLNDLEVSKKFEKERNAIYARWNCKEPTGLF